MAVIARCPEHGLHGERASCFVCGGPVEQVQMVEVRAVYDWLGALARQHGEEEVGRVLYDLRANFSRRFRRYPEAE